MNRSVRALGLGSLLPLVAVALLLVGSGLAPYAEALSPAAEAEANAIRSAASAIRQAEQEARALRLEVDAVLRDLAGPGARARGAILGWERRVTGLRERAARLAADGAGLRVEALSADREDPMAARALRTHAELDPHLRRLGETIEATARPLQDLQSRMREPEPAPKKTEKRPPPATEQKQGRTEDLSGVWTDARGVWKGKGEWRIAHTPKDGAVTVTVPTRARSVEFVGTFRRGQITAKHPVTDPEVLSSDAPEKVRRQAVARQLVWHLRLHLTSEGELRGSLTETGIGWSSETLKLGGVVSRFNDIVLVKKSAADGTEKPKEGATAKRAPDREEPPPPEPPPTPQQLEQLTNEARKAAVQARGRLAEVQDASNRLNEARRTLGEAEAAVRRAREWDKREPWERRLARELRERRENLRGDVACAEQAAR